MRQPLPLGYEHWRSRWLVASDWALLHRVAYGFVWYDGHHGRSTVSRVRAEWGNSLVHGRGPTVCGLNKPMRMPGVFSRMLLRRCPVCCKRLGLRQGFGAPFNDKHLPKEQKCK